MTCIQLHMVNKKGTLLQIWLKSLVSPNKAEQLFRHKFQTIWTVRLHQLVVMQPCVATPSHQSILSPAEAKNVPIFFAVMRLRQSEVTRPIYLGSKNWVTVDEFFLSAFNFWSISLRGNFLNDAMTRRWRSGQHCRLDSRGLSSNPILSSRIEWMLVY